MPGIFLIIILLFDISFSFKLTPSFIIEFNKFLNASEFNSEKFNPEASFMTVNPISFAFLFILMNVGVVCASMLILYNN